VSCQLAVRCIEGDQSIIQGDYINTSISYRDSAIDWSATDLEFAQRVFRLPDDLTAVCSNREYLHLTVHHRRGGVHDALIVTRALSGNSPLARRWTVPMFWISRFASVAFGVRCSG
jgi:hypothetical protein